jgi:hypothetical protein
MTTLIKEHEEDFDNICKKLELKPFNPLRIELEKYVTAHHERGYNNGYKDGGIEFAVIADKFYNDEITEKQLIDIILLQRNK